MKQKKKKQLQKQVANPDDTSLILTETNLYLVKDFNKTHKTPC
jgi:hypothetical protein